MTKPAKKVRLAIFDIDGTIFRSSLFLELFYALIDRGIFPKKAHAEVEPLYQAWLNRQGHYNDYLMKAVNVHYKYLTLRPKAVIDQVARSMIHGQKDRVYRYTRDLIQSLKRQKYYLIAISNSQENIVQQFAQETGFDAAIARRLEIKNNKYTGRVMSGDKFISLDDHIDKVQTLHDFLASKKITPDLKNSIAIGDSEGDVALLSIVGRPIAFNPSTGLAKIAKKKGWKIVVERKDVIYEVKDCAFLHEDTKQKTSWK